ncbi:MAG: nucleotidyltransferase family protein, partial [Acidobacteria bacterium]|nr:nucleotidyltransferase family protein [Acidobacteriota bacterium]
MKRSAIARAKLFGQILPLEAELLLHCAHARRDSTRPAHVRQLLREDVNWERLIALAQRHSLTPLLYWQLRHFNDNAVPATHLNNLRNRFYDNAARNLFLAEELLKIARLLETNGIRLIPYKGPALAVFAYGDLSLRRFGDLDIIVCKKDIARVKEVLVAEDYVLYPPLTNAQQAAVLRTQHSLAFVNADKRIVLELHWDVAGKRFSAQYDPARVWQRLETVHVGGGTLATFSAEDQLFALCVHGSKHLWERLAWVCDIAELIVSHEEIDWAMMMLRARASGSWRMLALGLLLANEMFDAPLPAEVKQAVDAEAVVRQLAEQIAENAFTKSGHRHGLLGNIMFNFRIRERWRDRLGYCGFIFSPTDADLAAIPLPAMLGFLDYLLRPLR